MKKTSTDRWCHTATKLIKFNPDRYAVQEELKQHLLDKQEYLREQGVPAEQIEEMSVTAMGSAEEIAPQLAAIHRPFWGYAYRVCCVILALVITLSLPFLLLKLDDLPYYLQKPDFESIFPDGTILWHRTPDSEVKIKKYTLTLTQTSLIDDGPRGICLLAQLKVRHPEMFIGSEMLPYIWAEDSQGTVYSNFAAQSYVPSNNLSRFIKVQYPQQYGLSCYYTLVLWDFCSEDANWIDLHYDRDGTQFTIRIDLPGGEDG